MPRVNRTKNVAQKKIVTTPSETSLIWAALSLGTFLVTFTYIATLRTTLEAFGVGALALVVVLTIEGLLRGRLWMFEPRFQKIFEDKNMPVRMLIFTGCIVLILETMILLSMALPQMSSAFPFCGAV